MRFRSSTIITFLNLKIKLFSFNTNRGAVQRAAGAESAYLNNENGNAPPFIDASNCVVPGIVRPVRTVEWHCDGELCEMLALPNSIHDALLSKMAVWPALDISFC